MLFTEPKVQAVPIPLGRFRDYSAQDRADLEYGGQGERLRVLAKRAPERRPADTIPAPATPPTR